jgi:hypothetical protein
MWGALSDGRTGLLFRMLLVLASTVMGLATTSYYLRFETSLFIASYDSQGYPISTRE